MNRTSSLVVVVVLVAVAAACTGSPTFTVEAAGPVFDNGQTFGSGNRNDTTTTMAAASLETTATDTTGRNGQTFGSGN